MSIEDQIEDIYDKLHRMSQTLTEHVAKESVIYEKLEQQLETTGEQVGEMYQIHMQAKGVMKVFMWAGILISGLWQVGIPFGEFIIRKIKGV